MIFSPLTKRALYFSAEAHDGQYRKGGKVPYIVHPMLVAALVSEYSNDERIISGALLHDVLEDCPSVSFEDIERLFGIDIANLVKEVSFLKKDQNLSWKENKLNYIKSLHGLSQDALLIIAADKMVNMQAYFETLKMDPKKIKSLFRANPEDYRWYYGEIGKILEEKLGDHAVVSGYRKKVRDSI